MRERPILFSAPLVRALLAGTKTQTRRLVRPQPPVYLHGREFRPIPKTDIWGAFVVVDGASVCRGPDTIRCPYGTVGDRLWVRESLDMWPGSIAYRADGEPCEVKDWDWFDGWTRAHVPSIHMPRWASRIDLEITGIRFERLQAITEADAKAEGVDAEYCASPVIRERVPSREKFRDLWDELNGERASWASDPFVWVVEFRVIRPALRRAAEPPTEPRLP